MDRIKEDKQSRKIQLMYFLIPVVFLLALTFVSADVNVTLPASNSNFTSATLRCNYSNVSTEVTSPISGNSSFSLNGVVISTTGFTLTNNYIEASASASALTDGLNANISCIVGNLTFTKTSTLNATNLGIYTNTPSCAFSVDDTNIPFMSVKGITITDASTKDALFSLSYNYSLWDANSALVTSSASQNPSFSKTSFTKIGSYNLGLIVKDISGNTDVCANKTIFVSGNDGEDVNAVTTSQTANQLTQTKPKIPFYLFFFLGAIGIGIVTIIIVILSGKK